MRSTLGVTSTALRSSTAACPGDDNSGDVSAATSKSTEPDFVSVAQSRFTSLSFSSKALFSCLAFGCLLKGIFTTKLKKIRFTIIYYIYMYKVCHMRNESLIKIAYKEDFKGPIKRGRPRKRWSDQLRHDTRPPLLTAERCVLERRTWRV